jgi:ubiquinone/menaquinone biosynthesis C-methylase UbiE
MKSVPAKIYDENYYHSINEGGNLFYKTKGKILSRRMRVSLSHVKIRKSDTILDFGCGRGDLVFYLAPHCRNVIGVDYSKDSIKICNMMLNKYYKKYKNIHFSRSTIAGLKLRDNSIDKIFLLDVVEHLYPKELDLLLNKLYRAMKSDAVLVIHTCPNTNFYKYGYPFVRLIFPILRKMPSFRKLIDTKPNWKGLERLPKNPEVNSHNMFGHVNEMSPKRMKKILIRHGFKTRIRIYPFLRELDTPVLKISYMVLSLPIIRFMFSADIMAIARKRL